MGKAMSLIVRANQRFNAESRAHRIISSEKPKPAPKYEANLRDLERTLRENPTLVEEMSKKNEKLDGHLKQVYVTSEVEIIENTNRGESKKSLPMARGTPEEFEFGYMEDEKAAAGKVLMRDVVKFLNDYHYNPTQYTSAIIAEEFKIKEADVQNVLKFYKPLSVHVNDPKLKRLPSGPADLPLLQGSEKTDRRQ